MYSPKAGPAASVSRHSKTKFDKQESFGRYGVVMHLCREGAFMRRQKSLLKSFVMGLFFFLGDVENNNFYLRALQVTVF
jgi:hypothetical protein